MDRSELETESGRLLGDPSHNRWSTTVLRDRFELAQKAVQAQTGAVKTTGTYTPVAETFEVTLGDLILDISRVTLTETDGSVHILEVKSREDMDFYRPNWPNEDSGLPTTGVWDPSNKQLILIPKPNSTYAVTNGLKVWEVRTPTALSGDSSEPFDDHALMQAYAMSVVYYTVALCLMDDGTPEALKKASFYMSGHVSQPGMYEKELKKINARFSRPIAVQDRVHWEPQGGRLGGGMWDPKSHISNG